MKHTKLYLTRRNNSIYYVGWIEDGKRHWKSTKCSLKSEALQFLKQFQDNDTQPVTVITLSECFELFKAEQSVRPSTLITYGWSLKSFLSVCGNKLVASYTLSDIEYFKKAQKHLSPVTVNIYLRSMMSIFSFAVRKGVISKNLVHFAQLVKIQRQPPSYIRREDFPRLLEHAKSQLLKDIFTFAATTGLRASELINLKWVNVDLARKQISIVNTEDFTTKSGRSRVVLTCPPESDPFLS